MATRPPPPFFSKKRARSNGARNIRDATPIHASPTRVPTHISYGILVMVPYTCPYACRCRCPYPYQQHIFRPQVHAHVRTQCSYPCPHSDAHTDRHTHAHTRINTHFRPHVHAHVHTHVHARVHTHTGPCPCLCASKGCRRLHSPATGLAITNMP